MESIAILVISNSLFPYFYVKDHPLEHVDLLETERIFKYLTYSYQQPAPLVLSTLRSEEQFGTVWKNPSSALSGMELVIDPPDTVLSFIA